MPVIFFVLSLLLSFLCLKRYGQVCGLLILFCFFWLGQEISRPVPLACQPGRIYPVSARCEERLTGNNHIVSCSGHRFYLSRFQSDTAYSKGDSLHFHALIEPVPCKTNPGEFDYSLYLERKGVRYRLIPCTAIKAGGKSRDLMTWFSRIRAGLLDKTARLTEDTMCRQLVNALCLGYKQDTDDTFEDMFILTGTMHLLSVSGLHTGAIFLLMQYLLKWAGVPGRRTWIFSIPLIWAYAALTGMSPSVLRAATILTFITAGQQLSRTYIPLNALAASAFLALTANPDALYSLSFLLSYSAYGGIILLYPHFKKYIRASHQAVRPLLSSCAVSVSAQLPTLPVSAYFFHTVNISGLLANIIAIPLATLVLYSATVCILLPEIIGRYLFWIPETLGRVFLKTLEVLVPFSFNIEGLYPESTTVVLIYAAFLLAGRFLFFRRTGCLYASAAILALLLTQLVLQNRQMARQCEVTIFHRNRASAIALRYKGFCYPLHSGVPFPENLPYLLKNRLSLEAAVPILAGEKISWEKDMLCTGKDSLAIIWEDTPPHPSANILVITRNAGPDDLYPSGYPGQNVRLVVTDGSNRFQRSKEWEAFCRRHGIAFRNTAETGAVVLPIE